MPGATSGNQDNKENRPQLGQLIDQLSKVSFSNLFDHEMWIDNASKEHQGCSWFCATVYLMIA